MAETVPGRGKDGMAGSRGVRKDKEVEIEEELDMRRQKDVTPFFVSKPFVGLISFGTSG